MTISRQQYQDEIKKELVKLAGSYETDEDGFYKDTLAVIEQLQAELDKHRWIPVSEKPKENGRYLVCIEDYCKKVNPSVSWREANWINERGWLEINMSAMPWKVTHWKPIILPEETLKE